MLALQQLPAALCNLLLYFALVISAILTWKIFTPLICSVRKKMATEFACQDIRYKNSAEPVKVPEEMYKSGAMEVEVTQPINPLGHK